MTWNLQNQTENAVCMERQINIQKNKTAKNFFALQKRYEQDTVGCMPCIQQKMETIKYSQSMEMTDDSINMPQMDKENINSNQQYRQQIIATGFDSLPVCTATPDEQCTLVKMQHDKAD